ncbi:DEAD/DEAH box helicase [Limibaculum sp. FT325]|uniref:DEAD/DEAH box helicase n=1 Tax=Thermohalobaculum sediminis TaxID=2939436 RepID=UPI0020BEC377|nr:DEAD/DEAH box helicase [Limibaculum sediminis]MCL5775484.1 DEAD/DEAH box helicase [Limibaculum sediminis]
MKFSDLDLDPKVLQAVVEAGYETPTPIQAQAIPEALKGRDVLGIAQTGTGKTASFTLPMITLLAKGRARARMPRSLILCPTRELAAQVAENFEIYGKYHKLSMALLIGGVSFKDQDKLIDRGVDVLIATPGRLLDHFERGKLMLTGVQVMVVDEADRMLDMGFIPDIERIFSLTPFTRQTLFFSATMPPEITRLTEAFLHNPIRVEVAKQATTAETVTQGVTMFRPSRKDKADTEKRALLRAMIDGEGEKFRNAIIFCNRKRDVGVLYKSLHKHGYNCGALHGDLDQSVRTATLNAFRDGTIKILVASDVAARGLDIPNVSHIFNFDLPMHAEDYVHRIGRTGRAGREGIALSICAPYDQKYLDKIEELIGKPIPRRDLPAGHVAAPESAEPAPHEDERPRRRAERGERRREERPAVPAPKPEAKPEAQPAETRAERETPREPRRERDRGGRRSEGRGDKPVIGLGDHVPDFLLRPVPIRATRKTTAGDGEGEESGSEAA